MTEFRKCQKDFDKLTAPVNDDPMNAAALA